MVNSAASESREFHFKECLVCFYDICRITTLDSSFTGPAITVFTASIKSSLNLLPSEILTVIIERERHETATVFCYDDGNTAADSSASHSLKHLL